MSPLVMHLWASAPTVAIARVTSAKTADTGNDSTVTLWSDTEADDLQLVLIRWASSSLAELPAVPSGWEQVASRSATGTSVLYARVAGASEPSSVTITAASTVRSASVAYRVRGAAVGETAFREAAATGNTGTTEFPQPPSLSPTWGATAETLFIAAGNARQESFVLTAATNYGEGVGTYTLDGTSTSTFHARIFAAERRMTAASEQPGSFGLTGTFSSPHVYTIGVRLP